MSADPRDDFAALSGTEHRMHGLDDPYAVIRREVVTYLRMLAPDTDVERIAAYGDPKSLTTSRRDGETMTVTGFGVCFRAQLTSTIGYAIERADATVTLLGCRWSEPGHELVRAYVDLGADADRGYSDQVLERRLVVFRDEVAPGAELR